MLAFVRWISGWVRCNELDYDANVTILLLFLFSIVLQLDKSRMHFIFCFWVVQNVARVTKQSNTNCTWFSLFEISCVNDDASTLYPCQNISVHTRIMCDTPSNQCLQCGGHLLSKLDDNRITIEFVHIFSHLKCTHMNLWQH